MTVYDNDHEQWEALKKWWKANGKMTVLVIVLAMGASFGFRYWQDYRLQKSQNASLLYEQLLSSRFANQPNQPFNQMADTLVKEYEHTPYARLAALFQASWAVDKGDLNTAETKLRWVMDHARSGALRQITKLRVARVLLAKKQPEEALSILEKVEDKAYIPAINQVRGDIYLAQGERVKARSAYQAALDELPAVASTRPLLQMKIDSVKGDK